MTGFNLPPGCNVCDIPGNGYEDERFDRIVEQTCDGCDCYNEETDPPCRYWDEPETCPLIKKAMAREMDDDYGWDNPRSDAEQDEDAMARAYVRQMEQAAEEWFENDRGEVDFP